MMNGIKCTVKALDGKVYETTVNDWYEQELSNGVRVWTKLLNIGNGKMVAISHQEAVNWGIDSLHTAGEKISKAPKQSEVDKHAEVIREDIEGRLETKRKALGSGTARRELSRPMPTSDTPPAPRPAQPVKKKSAVLNTADLIEEEAKSFSQK